MLFENGRRIFSALFENGEVPGARRFRHRESDESCESLIFQAGAETFEPESGRGWGG